MGKSRFAVVFAMLLMGGAVLAADPDSVDQSVIDKAYARLRARQAAATESTSRPAPATPVAPEGPANSIGEILLQRLEQLPAENRPRAETGWDAFSTEDTKKLLDKPGVKNAVVTEKVDLVGVEIYRASKGGERDAVGWDILLYFRSGRISFADLEIPVWVAPNHNPDGFARELSASNGQWAESCIHMWVTQAQAREAMQWLPGDTFTYTGRIAQVQLAQKGANPDQWASKLPSGKFGENKIKPKSEVASKAGAMKVAMEDCELIQVPQVPQPASAVDHPDHASGQISVATPIDPNARRVEYLCCATARISGPAFKEIQEKLTLAVGYLSAGDQFNVLLIQGDPWLTHPTTYVPCFNSLTPASRNARQDAAAFIRAAKAQGSSSPIPAIAEAASRQPNLVFLIWKGDFEDPDADAVQAALVDLRKKTQARIILVDAGVSEEHPPTNRNEFEMYRRLARACDGVFLNGDELVGAEQTQATTRPGASDAP